MIPTEAAISPARIEDPLALRDRVTAEAARCFARSQAAVGVALLHELQFATIDEATLRMTDPFLPWVAHGRRIIASFDPRRIPSEDEVVIIYGNYPHGPENLVVNNPMRRHVAGFWDLQHDRVEYDARWDAIDRIFIINGGGRADRYDAVLRELAAARAPFARITRLTPELRRCPGESPQLSGTIGALEAHLDVSRQAYAAGYSHILVLEDDFCFTSDLDRHLQDLGAFFARRYDYWICMLATSKYGLIVPKDDLVSMTRQPCTNAAAHLISREGLQRLVPVQEAALAALKAGGDPDQYAADRCWAALQNSEKFLVFRKKFGFQTASFSNIEGKIARYLD